MIPKIFFSHYVPPPTFIVTQEMMKSVVPGWARPCEMIGKEAGEYKLYGTTGEPCLFKRISPRDIEQGQEMSIESDGPGFLARRFFWRSQGGGPKDDDRFILFSYTPGKQMSKSI